jgi:lipopolysaccharide assembly outer membrane protein LptD (OstA)
MGVIILSSNLISGHRIFADAYISEDKVYYGADSYTIDYEREIIYAKGHAYFKKEDRRVQADRIKIYYSRDKKKAEFFNNVRVQDITQLSEIRGDYGEALFKKDTYIVEGNATYTDEKRTVSAQRVQRLKDQRILFSEDVVYSDGIYEIKASKLDISGDTAEFTSDVDVLHLESGDIIYCNSLTYLMDLENVTFQGEVLYLQKEDQEGKDALVMRANGIRYFKDQDVFLLLGDVLILTESFTMNTSIARYMRNERKLESTGDIIVSDRTNYIYCNRLSYDEQTKRIIYFNTVQGIVSRR